MNGSETKIFDVRGEGGILKSRPIVPFLSPFAPSRLNNTYCILYATKYLRPWINLPPPPPRLSITSFTIEYDPRILSRDESITR